MKIVRQAIMFWQTCLEQIKPGECLMFESAPHQKHRADDVFIRVDTKAYPPDLEVQGRYVRYQRNWNKLAVVNMRTGALAFISKHRKCRPVDASLHVED